MNMKCAFAIAATASFPLFGATNVWTGAVNDWNWNAPGNYRDGLPAANDVVQLPAGATARLLGDDADSLAVVNSLDRICPASASSRLVVSNDTKVSIDCQFSWPLTDRTSSYAAYGELIKVGSGELVLTHTNLNAYLSSVTVREGVLRLPTSTRPTYSHNFYYISVSNGATLFTVSNRGYTSPKEVFGTGLITNDSSAECFFQMWNNNPSVSTKVEAKFGGDIRFKPLRSVDIISTNNTMKGGTTTRRNSSSGYTVTVGLSTIGNPGEASSSGIGNMIYYDEFGGVFRYLGEGEETRKGIRYNSQAQYPGWAEFDGGPTGRLKFTEDSIWMNYFTVANMRLTGSNLYPCVISAPINFYSSAGATNGFTFTKRGTGTWRFNHSKNREAVANVSVEEGTLQFETLYPKGEKCAFGPGTNNYPVGYSATGYPDRRVPYSIALGSPAPAAGATPPLFEFVNDSSATCGVWSVDRGIVLRGDVRIRNSTSDADGNPYPMRLAQFSSITNGTCTMFLEGDRDGEDVVGCISDGTNFGKVAIVKTGGGTWYLAGTNSFTGGLTVSNGTLNVISSSGKYTWFRWMIRKNVVNESNSEIQLAEFGIYDAASNRVNGALAECMDFAHIKPGQTAFQRHIAGAWIGGGGSARIWRLFDGKTDHMAFRENTESGSGWRFNQNDPSSWYYILMRLDPGCNEAAYYDWASSQVNYSPELWSLHGSVDGIVWDDLDVVEEAHVTTAGSQWAFDRSGSFSASAAAVHGGRAIAGSTNKVAHVLSPNCPVAVAGGVLKCIGKAAIANLSVDCSGAGTIDGFDFAQKGTLNVEGMTGDSAELPISFENANGLENISGWTLKVGGVKTCHYRHSVADGKIKVYKIGVRVIIR